MSEPDTQSVLWTTWGKDPHTFWGSNCSF